MLVALLHHTKSMHLAKAAAEVKVPNLKSSGGTFKYGAGLKGAGANEETMFLIEQLKLIGQQLNDLLLWLDQRVQGELAVQDHIERILETAQKMLDTKLEVQ